MFHVQEIIQNLQNERRKAYIVTKGYEREEISHHRHAVCGKSID